MFRLLPWKPLLRRAVVGRWESFRMTPPADLVPPPHDLRRLGLYLHVPFCKHLCPFCPYNRHPYSEEGFRQYERAVRQEIDMWAPSLKDREIVSLYVGGGTPTLDVAGLLRILRHLGTRIRRPTDTCIELHPSNMDQPCLEALREVGVSMVSIGVESTRDHLLRRIGRSHDGAAALDAVRRAMAARFDSVNVDLMFALPGQTLADWREDLRGVLAEGVDQLSTYPLFAFPYSDLGREGRLKAVRRPPGRVIRSMLEVTDRMARASGLHRCAVWSWLRPRKRKFSSITRHHYVGFGPSAASMTGSQFTVNTFDVAEYAGALPGRRPVALSLAVDRRLEMAYWLYWRLYELHVDESDFRELFPEAGLRELFGSLFRPFQLAGLIQRVAGGYRVTDSGAYWIHRIQNEYSLNYINRLWGRCRKEPWPREVLL